MSNKIFPAEILEQTAEYQLAQNSKPTQILYSFLVISLLAGVVALPFLFIDVSVKSSGLLRAATELNTLKAISSGVVQKVYITENSVVQKGQLLFEVQSPVLEEKEKYLIGKVSEIKLFLNDLIELTSSKIIDTQQSINLNTPLYQQSLIDYRQKLVERRTKYQKAKQDYDRNKKLYDNYVIAASEFENFKFELDKATDELELLKQSQLSAWQQEFYNAEKEINDFQNQLNQTQQEKKNLNVTAPVSGAIQNLSGIYQGSPVFANQDLAQISPDTSLMAEIYVSPNDIGLLREGLPVRMQVGAFNYNQWGLLQGTVKEISNDIQIRNNEPFFEVKCALDQDHLTLKNGYTGKLKKGMTLQARFVVTKRSLWQLLYDKVDDWMNPDIRK